jgi:hypothetical protein
MVSGSNGVGKFGCDLELEGPIALVLPHVSKFGVYAGLFHTGQVLLESLDNKRVLAGSNALLDGGLNAVSQDCSRRC